jgi:hypothetical protein
MKEKHNPFKIDYDYKFAVIMFSVERGLYKKKFELKEVIGNALRSKINGVELMHIDIMKHED